MTHDPLLLENDLYVIVLDFRGITAVHGAWNLYSAVRTGRYFDILDSTLDPTVLCVRLLERVWHICSPFIDVYRCTDLTLVLTIFVRWKSIKTRKAALL